MADQVQTFEELCELVLLEQFKETLPECMAIYLSERSAKTLTEAAVIADEYALTHKVRGDYGHRDSAVGGHKKGSGSELPSFKEGNSGSKLDSSWTCNYCLGQGHWKNECPMLESKSEFHQSTRSMRPVALAVSVRAAEKAEAIASMRLQTKPVEVVAPCTFVVFGLVDKPDLQSVDPYYHPYVSRGFVSFVGSDKKVPVNILRD